VNMEERFDIRRKLRLLRQNSPEATEAYIDRHHVSFTEALQGNSHVKHVTVVLFVPAHRDLGAAGEQDFVLWKKFCKALGSLESLNALHVCREYNAEDHAEAFDEGLEEAFSKRLAYLCHKTTQVKELHINGCIDEFFENRDFDLTQWTTPRMAVVAKEIMAHPILEDFSFVNYTFDTRATLDTLASAVCTVPNLRCFSLYTGFNTNPVGLFSAMFVRRLMKLSTLRSLSFYGFDLEKSHVNALCLQNSTVENLALEGCRLPGTGIDAFMHNQNLTKLDLSRILLNGDHCVCLGYGLRYNTNLKTISMGNCFEETSVENLGVVFSALGVNDSLQVFELGYIASQQFSAELLRSLTLGLKKNERLKTLNLQVSFLRNESGDLRDFASSIRDHNSLSVLDFSWSRFTPTVLSYLLSGLKDSASLRSINLDSTGLGDDNASDLGAMIQGNKCCERLEVMCNTFSSLSYPTILSGLQENETLEELILFSSGSVNDETQVSFLEGLSRQKQLKRLVLNGLSDESGVYDERIIEAYRKNYSLEDFSLCPANRKYLREIATILRLNKAGRRYIVEDGLTSRIKGVAVLAAVSDDLDCVFMHLKENPSLCDNGGIHNPTAAGRKRKRSDGG